MLEMNEINTSTQIKLLNQIFDVEIYANKTDFVILVTEDDEIFRLTGWFNYKVELIPSEVSRELYLISDSLLNLSKKLMMKEKNVWNEIVEYNRKNRY